MSREQASASDQVGVVSISDITYFVPRVALAAFRIPAVKRPFYGDGEHTEPFASSNLSETIPSSTLSYSRICQNKAFARSAITNIDFT